MGLVAELRSVCLQQDPAKIKLSYIATALSIYNAEDIPSYDMAKTEDIFPAADRIKSLCDQAKDIFSLTDLYLAMVVHKVFYPKPDEQDDDSYLVAYNKRANEFATAIFIIDKDLFCQLSPDVLSEEDSPAREEMARFSNNLVSFVVNEILAQNGVLLQNACIEFYIDVAMKLEQLGDCQGLASVFSALIGHQIGDLPFVAAVFSTQIQNENLDQAQKKLRTLYEKFCVFTSNTARLIPVVAEVLGQIDRNKDLKKFNLPAINVSFNVSTTITRLRQIDIACGKQKTANELKDKICLTGCQQLLLTPKN